MIQSIESFKSHLDNKHTSKGQMSRSSKSSRETGSEVDHATIQCDLCTQKSSSIKSFKHHMTSHHTNAPSTNHYSKHHDRGYQRKYDKPCLFWNQGFCKFTDEKCSHTHQEIPECRFQGQFTCFGCKYYH